MDFICDVLLPTSIERKYAWESVFAYIQTFYAPYVLLYAEGVGCDALRCFIEIRAQLDGCRRAVGGFPYQSFALFLAWFCITRLVQLVADVVKRWMIRWVAPLYLYINISICVACSQYCRTRVSHCALRWWVTAWIPCLCVGGMSRCLEWS